MPTFETEVPSKPTAQSATEEFRPRKRGERYGTLDETFDPAPIPPEVKKAIDKRINDMMRQSRGPDETLYSIRGWLTTAKKIIVNLPTIVKDVILRRESDVEDDEEEIEEEEEAEVESENNSSEAPRAAQAPDESRQRRKHRQRHGSHRHYNRDDRDFRRDGDEGRSAD
jgi:hypothetical protein